MRNVTLRQAVKEAATALVFIVLFAAFAGGVFWGAFKLIAAGETFLACALLLASVFVALVLSRWLHDRL